MSIPPSMPPPLPPGPASFTPDVPPPLPPGPASFTPDVPPPAAHPPQRRRFGPLLLLAGGGCACLLLLCVVGLGALGLGLLPALVSVSATTSALPTPLGTATRTGAGLPPISIGGTPRANATAGIPRANATAGALVQLGIEVNVPSMGANHVALGQPHAAYNSLPPTSGPHYDSPAPWGDPHAALPEERWLHNLEHSGVVALYNCPQGCPALVQALDNFLKTGPQSSYGYVKLLVVPYSKIPNKLTLVAWEYYLPLADYDEAAMQQFFADHQDNGPEDVP